MIVKNIIMDDLEKKYSINDKNNSSNGITISYHQDELVIKGSSFDLIELANLLVNVALSTEEHEHLHIDELTLLNQKSEIKNIIIEKRNENE